MERTGSNHKDGYPSRKSGGAGWQFFIDRGGTFTDIVAITPGGRLLTHKLLSENPARYADAALAGIDLLLARHQDEPRSVSAIRLGTTIGTNALLERRGAHTALVITEGFADLLRIGSQQRPDIFALNIELPEPLYSRVIEARERIAADGSIITKLDVNKLADDLLRARRAGATSVAIAFLNAYRDPVHEQLAADIAAEAGFEQISVSSEINPSVRITDRGDTAVIDAYLGPVLEDYKQTLRQGLFAHQAEQRLWFMQSHGGLAEADRFRACDSILSGPAGGVVGMAATARESGFEQVIGFDMGGTSTDVSVYAGNFERTQVSKLAGCRIARPMLRINTVASGGGSLLTFRDGRLQVGPESAGADPGPACYRNGGPLALTDANVLLGRIQPDYFPAVFGPGADQSLDKPAVEQAFDRLRSQIAEEDGTGLSAIELAEGFQRIAIASMANAIEQVSVQRGYDVTRFALACFGGAGGQFACGVADALGIDTVLIHPLSGVLSAYGIGMAEERTIRRTGLHAPLDGDTMRQATAALATMSAELADTITQPATFEFRAFVRASGSDTLFDLPLTEDTGSEELARSFAASHRQRFGFGHDGDLILQSVEAEAVVSLPLPSHELAAGDGADHEPVTERDICFDGKFTATPVWLRASLTPERPIAGPAMIAEDNATVIVEPGWTVTVDARGMLIMHRTTPLQRREAAGTTVDPIMLEIFNNKFMHAAEQMGVVLEQSAHSVNIKERLDYSCALFDRNGELIANAPHVPVHLGSMGDSVREVIDRATEFRQDDAFMLNAPYAGGTHLPDITVVSPVFAGPGGEPVFFVASRAHHADIGGITPGSMPANSTSIDQEGIVLDPLLILRDGELKEDLVRSRLSDSDHPARNPDQNVADLKAQLAANARGQSQLQQMIGQYGLEVVEAYMRHVRDNAESCARTALRSLHGGHYALAMDTGERIEVDVSIDAEHGEAVIDFTGTSTISPTNLNAPKPVVRAVVLYVLRTLINQDIPLNAGCLAPVEIVIPDHSLLDPVSPAAVAGGNVETSQCIADALFAAFGAAAASQGTMNNFSFGNARHQYYETICGGTGAGPGFNGASAVHSHMTNSRLTDVEVLEQRLPVRVRQFGIRRDSGGGGRWHGGNGVVREIEFLEQVRISLLANRRTSAPFGLAGGSDGLPGHDTVIRKDGSRLSLRVPAELTLEAGDRIRIETPGGGGYGKVS